MVPDSASHSEYVMELTGRTRLIAAGQAPLQGDHSLALSDTPPNLVDSFSSISRPLPGRLVRLAAGITGWTSRPIPCNPMVAIVSSRVGLDYSGLSWWFAGIRNGVMDCRIRDRILLTGEGMATERVLHRAARLFETLLVTISRMPRHVDANWFDEVLARERSPCQRRIWICDRELPFGMTDAVIQLADHLRVLKMRPHGSVHSAVAKRLNETCNGRREGSVWLLQRNANVSDDLDTRSEPGLVSWFVSETSADDSTGAVTGEVQAGDSIASLPSQEWLFHWTRGVDPRLDCENTRALIDRYLLGWNELWPAPLQTLATIAASGRLQASSRITRDSTPVVSFTEVPLNEFRNRRVFRRHLSRWDFESFGVAIRKTALEQMKVRPVIYGGEADWENLGGRDRPWFQLSHSGSGPSKIDWTTEREWRVVGDINLFQLPVDSILLFVDDAASAERLRPLSRWPVGIVP